MVALLYILFVFTLIVVVLNRKELVFPIIILISSLNPIIEKLTDPSMEGATWKTIGIVRVWPEYLLTFFLLIISFSVRRKKPIKVKKYNILLAIWLLLTFITVFFSQNIERSILIFPIAFLNPFLSYKLILKIYYTENIDEIKIETFFLKSIKQGVIVFSLIGFIMFIMFGGINDMLINDYTGIRSKAGIWLGNHGVQAISIFIPFIMFSKKDNYKIIAIFFILFSTFIGSSRTNYIILIIMLLIYLYENFKTITKLKPIVITFSTLLIFINFFQDFLNSYITFLFDRFGLEKNSQKLLYEDERFNIWGIATKLFNQYPFQGVGLSNFGLNIQETFSDAHNIFMSILVETGIINLIIFITIILITFINKTKNKFQKYAKYGMLLFVINGSTGSQLFTVSGFVSGIMGVFFFSFLGFEAIISKSKLENQITAK